MSDDDKPVTCANCQGTGTVTVYEDGKPKQITCGVCGGSGLV